MPAVMVPVTIPAGQSLSNAADLTAGQVLRLIAPDEWTPANLSFQIATENVEAQFRNVYALGSGSELMISCAPGHSIGIANADFLREGFIKVRSGRSAAPIAQAADRTFQFVILR